MENNNQVEKSSYNSGLTKLIVCSIIGLFAFFVQFPFNGSNSIFVDHLANLIKKLLGPVVPYVCVAVMIAGAVYPVVKKTWNKNTGSIIMTVFKFLGVLIGFMYIFKIGPEALFTPDMLPFLFEKLAMSLTFVIPIGGALIIFLTSYGLMEFIGVFARPLMRPVFRTPGRSAIDAVASFVGSYSIGLLITGQQYALGRYTKREACIIATGFSTVSATFMVVVAKTLGLMEMWNLYFWVTLIVTFVVTAITAWIWPLCKVSNDYAEGVEPQPEQPHKESLFKAALAEGIEGARVSEPILPCLGRNFMLGFRMTMSIVPTIMSIGLLGLVLATYTPIFDYFGYIFYPFTRLLGFDNPEIVAKAASLSIAEMFLPAALVVEANIVTRFVIAVTCVSEILFFSASIPCVFSTGIPISIKNILIIWFERVALTILIVTPIAWLIFK